MQTLIIPPLPEIVNPLMPGSDITNEEKARDFKTKLLACCKTLDTFLPADNHQRQLKYAKLDELRGRIQSFTHAFPSHKEELSRYQLLINKQLKHLRRDFQTNSHWLEMTMHRTHFVETAPDITKTPQLKVNPYSAQSTLEAIGKLSRGVEKLRALHHLKTAISQELTEIEKAEEITEELKTKKKTLKESLLKVLNYAEFKIPLEEKFLALKQITWRDKDAEQTTEMRSLIDPSGNGQILYFLKKMESMEALSSTLCMLLKDRFYKAPSKLPQEILLEWPSDHHAANKFSDQNRKKFVRELLELQINFTDPFMHLIFDYLGNFFDPTGHLRCRLIAESNFSEEKKAQKCAHVISAMCRFKLDFGSLVSDLVFDVMPSKELGLVFPIAFEKKLSSKDIIPFAKSFKAEEVKCFLEFDLTAYMNDPEEIETLNKPLDIFHTSFRSYIKGIVAQSKNSDIVLQNLTLLALQLAYHGEFNLSMELYVALCRSSAESTMKKEFIFLKQLFNPFNRANISRFVTLKKEEGELCTPLLATISNECMVLKDMINQLRKGAQGDLLKVMGNRADFSILDEWDTVLKKLKVLGIDPKVKEVLDQLLKDEVELTLNTDKTKWDVHSTFYAFKLYYKGYQTSPAMQKIVDAIKSTKE